MKRGKIRNYLEYLFVYSVLGGLAALPRRTRMRAAEMMGHIGYLMAGRLRKTAKRNLDLAMPNLSIEEQDEIIRGVFRNFGRLLAEFSFFPKFTRRNIEQAVVYSGLDNFLLAMKRGRGVLFLTGHLGA